jgi:hypothetical protein
MAELTIPEFHQLLRQLLADPHTKIVDGKYLEVAEGGGLILHGRRFHLVNEALANADLLELLVMLHRDRVLRINYDKNTILSKTPSGQYPFLIAAIADFHGVRHNFNRDKYPGNYESMAQRVYAALRPRNPGYSPPERLYRHPGFWLSPVFQLALLIYGLMGILYLIGERLGQIWGFPVLILRTFPWGLVLIFAGYLLDHFLSWWHYDAPRPRPSGHNPPPASPSQPSTLPDGIWLGGLDEEPPAQQQATPAGPPSPVPSSPATPARPAQPASTQDRAIPHPQPAAAAPPEPEPPLLPVTPMARLDERQQAVLQEITEVAKLLDSAFNIPIINKSVGIDPLLGTVWGLGDAVSFLPATYIILRSTSLGLPSYKLVRMLRNVLIDTGIGLIPIVGQATDFFIKANIANLNIIHEHFGLPPYKRPR